jgi:chromate transporter
MEIFNFYLATFLVGILSFGGGKAYIPVFKEFYVDKYNILSNMDLLEYVAYASAFPGPISPMISGPIAFEKYGIEAFFVSIIILILPSVILFFIAMSLFKKYKSLNIINFIYLYLSPVIICLLLFVVFSTLNNFYLDTKYLIYCIILFSSSYVLFYKYKISPIWLILVGGLLGIIFLK